MAHWRCQGLQTLSNRPTYDAAKHLLQPSPVPSEAVAAAHACADAFAQAEKAAWDVFQDSQLAYEHPVHEQLDVLEVYADSDNRLTQAILSLGGRARRFTVRDGDLSTIEGQRRLWGCTPRDAAQARLDESQLSRMVLLEHAREPRKLPKCVRHAARTLSTCSCVPRYFSGKRTVADTSI